jgi:DNA-binding Lrp family transcriptional regulator
VVLAEMTEELQDDRGLELSSIERAIVARLQDDGRAPMTQIAEEIGFDESTVRRTIRKLVETGVIAITAVANPRLLGLEAMSWVALEVEPTEVERLPLRMLELKGVDYVATVGGRFQLLGEVAAQDLPELAERLRAIRALPGVRRTETLVILDLFHQEYRWHTDPGAPIEGVSDLRLTDLDRKLILALRADGRAAFRQIAASIGVPERRVRALYANLTRTGVVRVMAVLNPERVGLGVMACLAIQVRPGAPTREVALAIAKVRRVDYVVICTGRYDILAEVACADQAELLDLAGRELGSISEIASLEVFGYLRLQYSDESVWSVGRTSALQ